MEGSLQRRVIGEGLGTSSPFPDEAKLAFDRHILAILESIDDGFMSLNSHWCFTYVNRAAESIIDVEDVYPLTGTWFSLRISPSKARVALSFHETTKRNRSLQASLIELAYDAIIVRGPASRIVSWNRGADHLYGWTAQEAIGNVTHELLQTQFPASREALDRFLAQENRGKGNRCIRAKMERR